MEMLRLEGKRAVVTGGAMGIGKATVAKFLREGAKVAIVDINEAVAAETVAELSPLGEVFFIKGSVTDEGEVAAAFAAVEARWGALDVLVNNAGINAYYNAVTMTSEQWDHVFAVDLKGAWFCVKYGIPLMRNAGGGSIVNLGSVHSFFSAPQYFPYSAAKAGIVGMTKCLALDHGPEGIRANAVCPGYTRTHLVDEWLSMQENPEELVKKIEHEHALRRMGTPEDVANLIAFVASDEASFMTGSSIILDGGLTSKYATGN
jgi:NAD(P)-dependent dehydrogenase (short-subunit alcohol dehydrogenase family)